MPMTMSYDRPGCACSAFVSAARSVCDATTSRRSNCKSIKIVTSHLFTAALNMFIAKDYQNVKMDGILPVTESVAKVRAKLALKLVYHRSLSCCY